MPKFTIVLAPEAMDGIRRAYTWISKRSKSGGQQWHLAYRNAIAKLRENPLQFSLAPETERFHFEVRQLIFRTRFGRPYRLVFMIDDSTVYILDIRGPGQDLAEPS